MGNTQKPIQRKEIRPNISTEQVRRIIRPNTSAQQDRNMTQTSTSSQQGRKNPFGEINSSIKITAGVRAPALLQQMHIGQHEYSSLNEAVYMNEDLFCIDNEEKLKEPLHRSIGALIFLTGHHQRGVGSGILISQDTVLTVAHNIYNRYIKQKNKQFRFYLGAHGEIQDFYQIQSWKYPDQYQTCMQNVSRQYDYAIMKLKKPVVSFNEFLPLKIPCSICLLKDKSKLLKVFGFPATYEIRPNEKPIIYKDNCKILSEDGKKISLFQYGLSREDRIRFFDIIGKKIGYQMSTLPGQSGAPVTIDNCIIAIHSGNGDRKQFNQGRIIDKSLLKNLQRWGNLLQTQPFSIQDNKQCNHCPYIMGTFTMTDSNKVQRIGFGIMISENLVLTSAHNLFDRAEQADYTNIRFYLGSTITVGERFFQISSFKYPQQFKTCSSTQESMYDYALVMLQGEVPFGQFMEISLPCHVCLFSNMQSGLDIYDFPRYTCNNVQKMPNHNDLNNKEVRQIRLFQYGIFPADNIEITFQRYQMKALMQNTESVNIGSPLILNNKIIGITIRKQSDKFNIIRLIGGQVSRDISAWSQSMNKQKKYYCIKSKCYHSQIPYLFTIDGLRMFRQQKYFRPSVCAVKSLDKRKMPCMTTGVLLSKNILLTTAQSCYVHNRNQILANFEVRFEESDGISKSYFQIQAFRYPQAYKVSKDRKLTYDYALLKLKGQVNNVQFPKISLPCWKCNNGNIYLQISGFPTININWMTTSISKIMQTYRLVQYAYGGIGYITDTPQQDRINYRLLYGLQTHPGMSGSPIFFQDKIIAVHAGQSTRDRLQKVGRLINLELIRNIKKWCLEMQGEEFQVIQEDHICQ